MARNQQTSDLDKMQTAQFRLLIERENNNRPSTFYCMALGGFVGAIIAYLVQVPLPFFVFLFGTPILASFAFHRRMKSLFGPDWQRKLP